MIKDIAYALLFWSSDTLTHSFNNYLRACAYPLFNGKLEVKE